ncbi:MAG: type VI secretion system accessory protein TagJ [Gammaproteobacteria bacterium]
MQNDVRRQPADGKLRVFLAQLLMVNGDWDRALTQLSVAAELEASALPMLHTYSAAIQCERLRADVFRGARSPLVLGEPVPWLAGFLQALALEADGKPEQAASQRAEALEGAAATSGSLNGTSFEWIADADSRLGPILEVLLNGAYYWVPFERISRIVIEAPSDARDLVWLPAQFTWTNGGEAMGFLPVRYAGSESSQDNAVRLARKTEWRALSGDGYAGLGQRVLSSDRDEVGLLDVRELTLNAAA